MPPGFLRLLPAITAAVLLAMAANGSFSSAAPPPAPARFPAPPAEKAAPPENDQIAVLAGGCFWGMEGVFERVKGVRSVTSGYAGGTRETATYDKVSSETTGHAEAVRIVYDPRKVSFGTLLQVYFSVAHDPTQVNRQHPDVGPSYRSAIFPQTAAQRQLAAAYIASLDKSKVFARPIATRLESGKFYPAESWHQDFMSRNPDNSYTNRYDWPKIAALKKAYPALYRK